MTQKSDGRWVACDQAGQGIGDHIALVRDLEPAVGFLEAVARLAAGPVASREPLPEPPRRTRPARWLQTRADRQVGRVYRHGRATWRGATRPIRRFCRAIRAGSGSWRGAWGGALAAVYRPFSNWIYHLPKWI